jgi:hypothetical protein
MFALDPTDESVGYFHTVRFTDSIRNHGLGSQILAYPALEYRPHCSPLTAYCDCRGDAL